MPFVPPARHLVRAKDLADTRYAEGLNVAGMARAAGLSSAHFSREFRRAFARVPHDVGVGWARKPAWVQGLRDLCGLCVVCLRLWGRGGGGDAAEAGRFGDAEPGVEVALAGGELAGLGELAVC